MEAIDYQQIAFQLILAAGNAKSLSFKAIQEAKMGKFDEASISVENAEEELTAAHGSQFQLIQREANGGENSISVLLIHAQDHFMDASLMKDLAKEFIEMYVRMSKYEDALAKTF
ncbi:PTS lactose/cellobiose transporter subunit IIA [Alkalicella caledoniensis]|uniref:PTS lactose/cellobiose transporter subunit IIA n=1 Tax=Alkalicella caledoniensis TaxID=2731377 RepID=A0A7G9W7I4_ALKCA|nr:PTS lactose/cellobiose transporter subunit IIA [Alkalicella caledoniensis]QNO14646.1 PTS lactose/cellobiose transporter subunit IIA [Alkalicella caledoniensis]